MRKTIKLIIYLAMSAFVTVTQAATITVDSIADANPSAMDGKCTLREAIKAAETNAMVDNCSAGGGLDTVVFDPSIILPPSTSIILTDDLSSSISQINQSLTIIGPGADKLSIDGDGQYQIFHIVNSSNDQRFRFSGMTLTKGAASLGGAIYIEMPQLVYLGDMVFSDNTASSGGGAVFADNHSTPGNTTQLTIAGCTFVGNRADGYIGGGAIRAGVGSVLSITDSTFISNHAVAGGGGISVYSGGANAIASSLSIQRSSIIGNTTDRSGGGVSLFGFVTVPLTATIAHTTIIGNQADADNDSTTDYGGGVHLHSGVNLTLENTILAENIQDESSSSDIYTAGSGLNIISNGYNLIGNNFSVITEFPAGNPNTNHDIVGSSAALVSPGLAPIRDNGGPTLTRAPSGPSSAVVDKGNCPDEIADQRGFFFLDSSKRTVDHPLVANAVDGDGCDIGAVELVVDDSLCFPVKTSGGNVAVVCL